MNRHINIGIEGRVAIFWSYLAIGGTYFAHRLLYRTKISAISSTSFT